MKTIGNYEARTHWSEMLQEVKGGEQYVILHKGQPIAQLLPPESVDRQTRSKSAAARLLQLMAKRAASDIDVKALTDEGRD
jgi:antitoxin (DNA-binding transcriptional repressor) of toxin-antitoxin stability system